MTDDALAETVKTGIALLLVALSALVLLAAEILFHLSVLSNVSTGIVGDVAFVVGWGLFVTSTTYLVVSRVV